MAYNSSSSNANSKVHTCSTKCEQSYAQLKKLYDTQREQLGDASIEIQAYTQALKKAIGNAHGFVVGFVILMLLQQINNNDEDTVELAISGQTATGKESSNPFMAGSLPKTLHFYDSLQSDKDSFELIELIILCTNFLNMVRDLENLKTTYLIMKKVWARMHPNRGGLMMQMQRLPSLVRLQMMLETRTTRFQTTIRSEEVFGYILLVIKKLTLKKLDD
ncbi:hypothetical protein Tco_1183185 [Tanacetum coccineum]